MVKEVAFAFIIICILLSAISSAVSSDIGNNYQPKETVVVRVSGNILEPIPPSSFEIKRKNVKVPVEYDLKRFGNDYYVWFVTPQEENNYTFVINDVHTTVSGENKIIDYEKEFFVKGNLSDYYVKPGFFYATKNIEMSIYLNEDIEKVITVDFPEKKDIFLKPGENKVKLTLEDTEETKLITGNVGKYKIPIYMIGTGKNVNNERSVIKFSPSEIRKVILEIDSKLMYVIKIENIAERDINNVKLQSNPDLITVHPESIDLKVNNSAEFNVSFKESSKDINEIIYLQYEGESIAIPIEIKVDINDNSSIDNKTGNSSVTKQYFCSELDGKICSAGESCDGRVEQSKDGSCCIGRCVAMQNKNYNTIIGFVLGGIVILGLLYVYLKYKRTKGENIFKKKVKEAEDLT